MAAAACQRRRHRRAYRRGGGLGKKGGAEAAKALETAVNSDRFWAVQAAAAKALGALRTTAARDALLRSLAVRHPKARRGVVAALGEFRGDEAVLAAVAPLANKDQSWFVESEANRTAGKLRLPGSLDVIKANINRPSFRQVVRVGCMDGLVELRDEAGLAMLFDCARYGAFAQSRAAAVGAIGRLGEFFPERKRPLGEDVAEFLRDPDFRVRIAAANALKALKADQQVPRSKPWPRASWMDVACASLAKTQASCAKARTLPRRSVPSATNSRSCGTKTRSCETASKRSRCAPSTHKPGAFGDSQSARYQLGAAGSGHRYTSPMRAPFILAIDQGTTSSRALVVDSAGAICGIGQQPFTQYFPQPGWVEHDPEEIWRTTEEAIGTALASAGVLPRELAAVGIANQRETIVAWDRASGVPVANAIVWQDRRTAAMCDALRAAGHEQEFRRLTGLTLDPYFSGTKLAWLLNSSHDIRQRAEKGELAVGTIDSWLIWKLTAGARHVTDFTNASRTLLFNIRRGRWDEGLCATLDIPRDILPKPQPSRSQFGMTSTDVLGAAVPICGVAGDQQSALFGQGGFRPGIAKNTYGTGCFLLASAGQTAGRLANGACSHRSARTRARPAPSTSSKARCSSPGRWSSGCEMSCASSTTPTTSRRSPPRCPTPQA